MIRKRSLIIPGVDKQLLVGDAAKAMPDLTRRRFITGGASLGAPGVLSGLRTLAYLCTTCGRENAGCLIGLSAVFVVIGLALSYPLVTSIRGEVAGRKEPRQPVRWQKRVPQYIPQVSREDVDRILARDYPAGRHAAIRQMIERSDQGRDPRILLACLKNAGDDFERLRKQLLDDSLDWRDIISEAQYPGYIRHLLTIDQLTEEE